MIEGSCHCGAVRIEVETVPAQLTSCNCSICRRVGGLWAYYSPAQVRVTGRTVSYGWGERTLDLHHCPTCACTTHWTPTDPTGDRMGVNARMMDPSVVAAARVRRSRPSLCAGTQRGSHVDLVSSSLTNETAGETETDATDFATDSLVERLPRISAVDGEPHG